MNVDERDRLAMADAATLRAAGLDMPGGYEDVLNPSKEWSTAVGALIAKDRQLAALKAMQSLTRSDVRALLRALR